MLRLSPSYLENLGVVESEFLDRVRAADRNGDDRVSTYDVLLSTDSTERFYETLGVIEDWLSEVSQSVAQRLRSLDPERWSSLGIATGDPPANGWFSGTSADNPPIPFAGQYWSFDLDAATIEENQPTALLDESIEANPEYGAWLPSNIDDDDGSSDILSDDWAQLGPIEGENDLLPLVIHATTLPDAYYLLSTTGSQFRLWMNADRSGSVGLLPGNVDQVVYLEGGGESLAESPDFRDWGMINLSVYQNAPGLPSVLVAQNADAVRATKYHFERPWAVPGGGTYEFAVVGGAGGEESSLLDVRHGAFASAETQTGGPGSGSGGQGGSGGMPGAPGGGGSPIRESREVKWNKAEGIGEIRYQPHAGYDYWSSQTAVVKVVISESKIKSATQFTTIPDGDLSPFNEFFFKTASQMHVLDTRLTEGEKWSPFGNHSTAGDQETSMHLAAKSNVQFISPTYKEKKVGGDKLQAGFVQYWKPVSGKGKFLDHGVESVLDVPHPEKLYLDTRYKDATGQLLSTINPFYPTGLTGGYMPPVFAPASVSEAETGHKISMIDSPDTMISRYWLHVADDSSVDQIDSGTSLEEFKLYIAVRTTDTATKSDLRYFAFAQGDWNVRGDGNISAAGEWQPKKPSNGIWVTEEFTPIDSPLRLETEVTAQQTAPYIANNEFLSWWKWVP